MDMTPETGMILSIVAGVIFVGAGIWYFLPGKARAVLGAIGRGSWAAYEYFKGKWPR